MTPYSPTVFVDVPDPAHPPGGAVPLDATELNKIGTGISDATALAEQAAADAAAASADSALRLSTAVYGAKRDAIRLKDAAISSGQPVVTSPTAQFSVFDIGKYGVMQGAGAAGAQLASTIQSVQSPTQATLAANASTTVSGATFDYGSDNTAAINAMLAAATPPTLSTYGEAGANSATIPHGVYGFTGIIFVPSNVGLTGADATVTVLRALGPGAQFRAANPAGRTQASQMTQLNQGGALSGVLSGATITVTSTGDWGHDTAPGFASAGSLKTFGGGVASQNYTYTSKDATHFFGVSGGTAGVTVPDGVSLLQGDTAGSRGGVIGRITIDGNNVAGSSTQPLVIWGRIVQRTIVDTYVTNSFGDGEWWVVGQNSRMFNCNVENNRGNGRVLDAGVGGLHFYSSELTGNGKANGYNLVFRESIVSPLGYTSPTDNHFYGGVIERSGVDTLTLGTQIAAIYFGAYTRITFTNVNINSSRPTIVTTAALAGGETTIPINTLKNLPISVGSGGTIVIGNDLITFTGSTLTSLTGASGVVNPHPGGATGNWVANSSTIIGRDDNVNGAGLGSGLRFHNCILQGDVGTNGVQGTGYIGNSIFDFQSGGSPRGAPGLSLTGRNEIPSGSNIFLLDDTATNITEQQGSIRTSAALAALPGSNLVNWFVNAGGGVKTYDQLVRQRGVRAPTTTGTPTDVALGSASGPVSDGMLGVDTTNTRMYYRSGGAYQRVANFSDLASVTNSAGLEASIPSASTSNGVIYYATDTRVSFLSNGTTWRPISWPGAYSGMPLVLSNFGWDEMTLGTVAMAGSGSDTLVGIFIPRFFVVTKVGIRTGTTGATFGTNNDGHWYTLIRDQTGALQCSSADQGVGALAASSMKNLPLARDGANLAASSWTCPASAVYLCGADVYVGTGGTPVMPTLSGRAAMLALSGGTFPGVILSGAGQVGMTSGTPATTSTPAAATTSPFVAVTGS